MRASESLQKQPPARKYLVKRRQMQYQLDNTNNSMFSSRLDNQLSTFTQKDPFKKYQTLTTNLDNSIFLPQHNEPNLSMHLKTEKEGTQQLLPRINMQGKLTLTNSITNNSVDHRMHSVKLRIKQLSHHYSDPLYVKIQKTVDRRVMQKFTKYKREWVNSTTQRKTKSILERSFTKTGQMLENIRVDANKRKNTTNLQQMLRNNIDEKTFVFPAALHREVEGLKGKGGKVTALFEEVYMAEQVYRTHPSKQVYRTPPGKQIYTKPPSKQVYKTLPSKQVQRRHLRKQVQRRHLRKQF